MIAKYAPSGDVLVAHLEGEAVLLDLVSKRYFRLNATNAAIWRSVEAGLSRDEIVQALLDQFDVEGAVAAAAVDESLVELTRRGLLRETPEALRD
jgi:hypothetical protein